MKVIRHSMLPFRICVPSCYILSYLEMTSAFQGRAPDWPVSPAISTALEPLLQVCLVTGPTYLAQVDSLAFSSGGRLIGISTNPRVQWRGYHSLSSLMLLSLSVSHTPTHTHTHTHTPTHPPCLSASISRATGFYVLGPFLWLACTLLHLLHCYFNPIFLPQSLLTRIIIKRKTLNYHEAFYLVISQSFTRH